MNPTHIKKQMTSIYLSTVFAQECFLLLKNIFENHTVIKQPVLRSSYFKFNSEMVYRCMILELTKLLKHTSTEKFNIFDFIDKVENYKQLESDEDWNRIKWKLQSSLDVIKKITSKRDTLYAHTDKNIEKLSFGLNLTEEEIKDYSKLINGLWEVVRYLGGILESTDYSTTGLRVYQSLLRMNDYVYEGKADTFNYTFHIPTPHLKHRFHYLNNLPIEKQLELSALVDDFLKQNKY